MNRKLFKIHSWAGLLAGLFLLVVGISGSILVFNEEINHWLYADRLAVTVPPGAKRLSLDACYNIVKLRFPQMNYVGFGEVPKLPDQSVEFRMERGDVQYKAYVNPYTGTIIHAGERYNQVCDWLLMLHYSLYSGKVGELTVAILGLLLLISVVTGLWIYRKNIVPVLLFQTKIKLTNWRTISSGLHRIVGVWSLLFNLLIAVTGFWMLRYTFTQEHFADTSNKSLRRAVFTTSIDGALTTIQRAHPDFTPTYLFLPEKAGEDLSVYGTVGDQSYLFGNFSDEVTIDGHTGNIKETKFISQKTLSEQLESMVFPVHSGMYGHWTIKILYALLGLTPGLLSVTGFVLWWRRKHKPVQRSRPKPITQKRFATTLKS